MKKFKGLVVGIVVMSLMLTGSRFVANALTGVHNELSNLEETEVMAKLMDKSFDELLSDINTLGDSVDMSDLIFHADALHQKAAAIPEQRILDEILNEANSNNVRVILTQINRHLGNSENNEKLATLLEKKDVDFEIKRNVLLNIYQGSSTDTAIFEKTALAEDERLAFQAIKILNEISPEKAIKISDTIIQNSDGTVTDKVRAAIKVKASQLQNASTVNERQNFINFCDSLLITKGQKDDVVADTIIFALSDVMSEETISYIVTSEKIDNIAKQYCIDQNYSVLEEMITKDITNEKTKIVLEAMLIYPITEMATPLQEVLSSQLNQKDTKSVDVELSRDIQSTIDSISENGSKATGKY